MRRILIGVVVLVLILLPVLVVALSNSDSFFKSLTLLRYTTFHPKNPQISATSKVKEFAPKVVNTGYLDYIFAQMKIFEPKAIVDPEIYTTNRTSTKRHTINSVRIELVPTLDKYLLGIGGENDFAARGTYIVDGDTLFIRVSLNPGEIPNSHTPETYAIEDMYIDATLQTLVYATGITGKPINFTQLSNLNTQYKDYLKTGIFQRPIVIERKGN